MSAKPQPVRERPILFSAPMIRALLDGRKTQTRRIINPQPPHHLATREPWNVAGDLWGFAMPGVGTTRAVRSDDCIRCPFGTVGNRLWVRETWGTIDSECSKSDGAVVYRASHEAAVEEQVWKPSIHMPRWASRIDLEVTGVRVERLQAITEEDAKAEGTANNGTYYLGKPHAVKGTPKCHSTARDAFAELWDAINGTRSLWSANPWVWRIAFRRIRP